MASTFDMLEFFQSLDLFEALVLALTTFGMISLVVELFTYEEEVEE